MKTATSALALTFGLIGSALILVGCGDSQKQVAKELGSKGYELSQKDLLLAAAAGDVHGIELFHAAGMNIDEADGAGNTALMRASGAGQLAAVERLLGLGADPRTVNGAGRDALLLASGKGFEEVARMLLARGADPTARDKEGWSALSLAAFNGHAGTVSLLANGATSAELDDALLVASFSGDPTVINALLGQGANINARSPESKTPLMIAAESGRFEAVRVLLQNQANPYAVDPENRTASALAVAAGHESVSQLIATPEKWGSSPEGERVAAEISEARDALVKGGVEETLLEGRPLAGEPASKVALASSAVATVESEVTGRPTAKTSKEPSSVPASPGGGAVAKVPENSSANAAPAAPAVVARAVPIGSPEAEGAARQTESPTIALSAPQGASAGNPAESRRVREESKSKPLVALQGSTLHSREPRQAPVREMVLAAYHEAPLPIVVEGVSGSTASVRRLDSNGAIVAVEPGAMIPGTPYKVREVSPRFVSSKEGKGRMVDVSRVEVEDLERGTTHLLVKDAAGQTADTYAVLTAPDSQYRYVVKAGDVFRTTDPQVGARDYQVLDIRPNAVVIKDLVTEEVVTVARDGVVVP
jgi:ankyrin repeat protein